MKRKHPRPRKFSWLARSLRLEETLANHLYRDLANNCYPCRCIFQCEVLTIVPNKPALFLRCPCAFQYVSVLQRIHGTNKVYTL